MTQHLFQGKCFACAPSLGWNLYLLQTRNSLVLPLLHLRRDLFLLGCRCQCDQTMNLIRHEQKTQAAKVPKRKKTKTNKQQPKKPTPKKGLFFFKPSLLFFHFTMKASFHLFVVNEITSDKTGHMSMQKPLKPSLRKKKKIHTLL